MSPEVSPLPIVSTPGEIRLAGMRMCLLDIETSFYGLRKSLEAVVGPAASAIIYESGLKGGRSYGSAVLRHRLMSPDADGFRQAVHEYSEGGFGRFDVEVLDFPKGHAVIRCAEPLSFEAYACLANDDPREGPVCDFSRGVFAGLLEAFTGQENLGCVEDACRAAADPACLFRVDLDAIAIESVVGKKLPRSRSRRPSAAQAART